jgi:hypothetical protein
MITDARGWSPARRVRRPVEIPRDLDREVVEEARNHDSTPATYMADALTRAVDGWLAERPAGQLRRCRAEVFEHLDVERRVRRSLLLDRAVNSAVEEELTGSDLDISALTTLVIKHYLDGNGNGNGVTGNGNGVTNGAIANGDGTAA